MQNPVSPLHPVRIVICLSVLGGLLIFPVAASTATEDAQVFTIKGFDLYKQNRYADAIVSFDKAIALDPYAERPWYGKGMASYATKNYNDALKALDQATTLSPKDEDAWIAKGDTFAALGRKDLAVTTYERVLQLNPNNDVAKQDLATLGISLTPTPFVTSPTTRVPGQGSPLPLDPVIFPVGILAAAGGIWYTTGGRNRF
jgi:tetratricopeptide (TPR) repeat protein